jgi:hypothetical protein
MHTKPHSDVHIDDIRVAIAGLAKTTIPPLRRSGFCLFDEKPLDFGVFAWVFALHAVAPKKPAAGAKFDVL